MNLEHQEKTIIDSKNSKVANEFLNVESVRGSLYPLDCSLYRRRSKLNSMIMADNKPNLMRSFYNENKEIRDQIEKAVQNVRKKARQGDDVCERILEGVR